MPASKKISLFIVLFSLLIASLACLGTETPVAPPPEEGNPTETPEEIPPAYLWVMDNVDPEFDAPFGDILSLLDENGNAQFALPGYGTSQAVGGHHALAVSPAGDFVIVAEEVQRRLSRVNLDGDIAWTLTRGVHAAGVSESGIVYALTQSGTIYGGSLLLINAADGSVLGEYPYNGFDIIVDDERQAIWLVGDDIERAGFDMVSQFVDDPIAWCASAVDLLPDGSVVVTEREHSEVDGSLNRILHVSPGGEITVLASLDYSPFDVAVNPNDGTFWVTSSGGDVNGQLAYTSLGLKQYTPEGTLLQSLDYGKTHFIDVDHLDGSVWISTGEPYGDPGNGIIYHLSSDGAQLNRFSGYSGFTYLAITRSYQDMPTAIPEETENPSEVSGSVVISGLVENPIDLSENELLGMNPITIYTEHPSLGMQAFTGVPFNFLLDLVQVQAAAERLAIIALDGYSAEVDLASVRSCYDCMIAFTNTPGSFSSIMPGQPSSLWVRDVIQIVVK